MDEFLKIQRLDEQPSAAEFSSRFESRNVPTVFNGCIKGWKAFYSWNPSDGGLDYLQERIGSSIVEAMLSKSAPVFYGDLRSHERVQLPISTFLGYCKQSLQNIGDGHGVFAESSTELNSLPGKPQEIYLAQVPIMNIENKEVVQLETLRQDIQTPSFLEKKELASINLWMNSAHTRSSTHYDPHHNLLCIVSGCKQVVLWPPSASPMLYPQPIYGEASNHSSVALKSPDFSIHPRAECLMEYSQKVILNAGDALFIPEGWFHQVDSDNLTIAVNFWWQSDMMSSMLEHMDAYYLRRIIRRLTDKEMNEVLPSANSNGTEKMKGHDSLLSNKKTGCDLDLKCGKKDYEENNLRQKTALQELEPLGLQALHELVSFVHHHVSYSDKNQPIELTLTNDSAVGVDNSSKKIMMTNLFRLQDDPVAKIIWVLEPLTLLTVFLAMARNFPRTLEALIVHILSPVGAEALTRKFEEMDHLISEEDRNNFYKVFYGVFDDKFAAMDSILSQKESFACKIFKNILDQYLGMELDGSKLSAKTN